MLEIGPHWDRTSSHKWLEHWGLLLLFDCRPQATSLSMCLALGIKAAGATNIKGRHGKQEEVGVILAQWLHSWTLSLPYRLQERFYTVFEGLKSECRQLSYNQARHDCKTNRWNHQRHHKGNAFFIIMMHNARCTMHDIFPVSCILYPVSCILCPAMSYLKLFGLTTNV